MRPTTEPRRVFFTGATGSIGRATVQALSARGLEVVCLVRQLQAGSVGQAVQARLAALPGVRLRHGNPLCAESLQRDGLQGERFDIWVSCMASRTGEPADAQAVDRDAHLMALDACRRAGVGHVVLLSAICVQKPVLAFQKAKLAFEKALIESGLNYSIVRPTAFHKSLSGQFERVRRGRPFLVFGDGQRTACKPISDGDLANFIAECLDDQSRHRRILPIGGPGPAITPLQQARLLCDALGKPLRVRRVPTGLLDLIVAVLSLAAWVVPGLRTKAELARIGRYYASESMLWMDPATGLYSPEGTPSYGRCTLADHYAALVRGEAADERREHSVF